MMFCDCVSQVAAETEDRLDSRDSTDCRVYAACQEPLEALETPALLGRQEILATGASLAYQDLKDPRVD